MNFSTCRVSPLFATHFCLHNDANRGERIPNDHQKTTDNWLMPLSLPLTLILFPDDEWLCPVTGATYNVDLNTQSDACPMCGIGLNTRLRTLRRLECSGQSQRIMVVTSITCQKYVIANDHWRLQHLRHLLSPDTDISGVDIALHSWLDQAGKRVQSHSLLGICCL